EQIFWERPFCPHLDDAAVSDNQVLAFQEAGKTPEQAIRFLPHVLKRRQPRVSEPSRLQHDFTNIRRIDFLDDYFGRDHAVLCQLGVIDPTGDLLERVKMEKNQRLIVHYNDVATNGNAIVSYIPRREIRALVLQDNDVAEASRPVIQIFLIGKLILRSEEHTSELQSPCNLVCRLLLEKKKKHIQDLPRHRQHRSYRHPMRLWLLLLHERHAHRAGRVRERAPVLLRHSTSPLPPSCHTH